MSTTTSINITTTRNNEKKQKSITYINPLTSSEELIDFAQSIVAITNDSYDKTTRIDRTECDEVTERPVTKLMYQSGNSYPEIGSNLVINFPMSKLSSSYYPFTIFIQTPMDIAPIVTIETATEYGWSTSSYQSANRGAVTTRQCWAISFNTNTPPNIGDSFQFKVHFDATYQYDARDLVFTFNIVDE